MLSFIYVLLLVMIIMSMDGWDNHAKREITYMYIILVIIIFMIYDLVLLYYAILCIILLLTARTELPRAKTTRAYAYSHARTRSCAHAYSL